MKKLSMALAAILILSIVISGCATEITKDNLSETTIFDNFNGKAVSIGMRKSEVDEIWPDFKKEGDAYLYDHELAVTFTEGLATQLLIEWADEDEKRWVVMHGITIGSTLDEVLNTYGEPVQQIDLTLGIAYDYAFDNTVTRFVIKDEEVRYILIASV